MTSTRPHVLTFIVNVECDSLVRNRLTVPSPAVAMQNSVTAKHSKLRLSPRAGADRLQRRAQADPAQYDGEP